MNIKTFKKLAAVKDEALQNYALLELLETDLTTPLNQVAYAVQSTLFQEQYTDLILDLLEITKEDLERLVEFCSKNEIILDGNLGEYLQDMDVKGSALSFEVFKPLAKSHILRDIFNIHSVTGEIFTSLEFDLDITSVRIFEQLEAIIEFRLDNLTA